MSTDVDEEFTSFIIRENHRARELGQPYDNLETLRKRFAEYKHAIALTRGTHLRLVYSRGDAQGARH